MDFLFDRVASGRSLKILAIVDGATTESVATVVEHSMGGNHLTRVLDQICYQRGKPNQDACIESFNGRLRDECLSEHWFTGIIEHARTVIEGWRREYNYASWCPTFLCA